MNKKQIIYSLATGYSRMEELYSGRISHDSLGDFVRACIKSGLHMSGEEVDLTPKELSEVYYSIQKYIKAKEEINSIFDSLASDPSEDKKSIKKSGDQIIVQFLPSQVFCVGEG